jgi:hypothetical protein
VRRKLRRSTTAVRSAGGEEIWTVDFYVQEELRRSLQKEETDSRRISLRNPVSRWIGRRCSEFSLWRKRKEKGSEPSDLEQKYPSAVRLDRSCTRFSHRDISHREIGILEGKRIETFQVSKHWDLDR